MGLVGATVTGVTTWWWNQLVDIVGTAVLYLNVRRFLATGSKFVNADASCNYTLSYCRMTITHPGRKSCTTSGLRWTCGSHFCSGGSLETIPATEGAVTLMRPIRCEVIFSFCI